MLQQFRLAAHLANGKGNLIEILNPLGECHMNAGDKEQALKVWTRSLEINPNQAAIKKLIEKLK